MLLSFKTNLLLYLLLPQIFIYCEYPLCGVEALLDATHLQLKFIVNRIPLLQNCSHRKVADKKMFGEHWTSAAHKIINKEKILFVSFSETATTVEIDIKY